MKRTKHIYKSFLSLAIGQSFFIRRRKLAVKKGLFSCHVVGGSVETIAPWRKVRTLLPVTTTDRRNISDTQDAAPMAIAVGKYWPRAKDCLHPGLALPYKQHQEESSKNCAAPPGYPWDGTGQPTSTTDPTGESQRELTATEVNERQQRARLEQFAHLDKILSEAEHLGVEISPAVLARDPKDCQIRLRDPLVQDHTPSPPPEHERTL
jgi:hypothetical protein